MKLLRIFLSIVILIVAIILVAVGSLVFFINPDKLRPVIAQEIVKKTGYSVTIKGTLSWSFYPRFSVLVPDLALSKGINTPAFITLHEVKIGTALSHLLFNTDQLKGVVDIAEVQFLKLHAKHAQITLVWEHQTLVLKSITADLYDGKVDGMLNVQLEGDVAHWKWDATFTNLAIKPLIEDLYGPNAALIDGTAQVRLQGIALGSTLDAILNSLNGVTAFRVEKGTLLGASNLNELLSRADAWLNQTAPQPGIKNNMLFDQLTGSALIAHGVATTDNLLLSSPIYLVTGQGNFNLLTEAIDLSLHLKSQPTLKTQWDLPVTISGTASSPRIGVSLNALQQAPTQDEVKKIKTKLRDKAGKIVQHLLGG